MKTLRLNKSDAAAYAAGERCFWRAMKPQPNVMIYHEPYWDVGGFRLRPMANNPIKCPYESLGDKITVTQRDGKWGWLVEVGA